MNNESIKMKKYLSRLTNKIEVSKNISIIQKSGLFDNEFYLNNNHDVKKNKINPIRHYLKYGWKEGRDPSQHFSTNGYLAMNEDVKLAGLNPLLHYIRNGKSEGRVFFRMPESAKMGNVSAIFAERFPTLSPLSCYQTPNRDRVRINIVTDSINAGSLFGGVITALVFAFHLASKNHADVRIITRSEEAEKFRINEVLENIGISFNGQIEFLYAHFASNVEIDICEKDQFITTSWWTTYSTLKTIPVNKIIYLLQEDERMFYPYGDDHLLANEIMSNSKLKYIINTKLLYDHLISTGLDNIQKNGLYFEPAFDKANYYLDKTIEKQKLKLFFYARPNNLRNIFYRGIEILDKAINLQIIDTNEWEIYLVGKDIPNNLTFTNGYQPKIISNLNYDEYGNFIRTVDLGFSLMYTPHPSYPPLDLAACGAVVVTNSCGIKSNLTMYSENIITVSVDEDSLLNGLIEGVALAKNQEQRIANYETNKLNTNWSLVMSEFVKEITL
jgi:hypothetical protein